MIGFELWITWLKQWATTIGNWAKAFQLEELSEGVARDDFVGAMEKLLTLQKTAKDYGDTNPVLNQFLNVFTDSGSDKTRTSKNFMSPVTHGFPWHPDCCAKR